MNQDQEHLKLLSILHYVFGGLTALFSLFPLIYVALGVAFLMAPAEMGLDGAPPAPQEIEDFGAVEGLPAEEFPDEGMAEGDLEPPPFDNGFAESPMSDAAAARFVGGMFVVGGSLFFLISMVCAALVIIAGRNLGAHRGYVFCLVIAALECLAVPFGTILGVFTIVVLQRESVKELFGQGATLEEADTY